MTNQALTRFVLLVLYIVFLKKVNTLSLCPKNETGLVRSSSLSDHLLICQCKEKSLSSEDRLSSVPLLDPLGRI